MKNPNHSCLTLVLSLAVLGVLVSSPAAFSRGLYYKEVHRDGRIFVFNDPAEAERFEAYREIGTTIARVGAGPNGETVIAGSEAALELFLLKHGVAEPVPPAQEPALKVEWRDGKTRITTDNAYLELSNRIQVRYTQEFPDETVQLPGTGEPGDGKGSFRIRRAKLKLEGWIYEDWLEYELQANWPGVAGSNAGALLEDANLNWDVTGGKRHFMVKIGQFKVPFGQQELTSSGSQQFVDRALVSNFYFQGRDTGIQVWGQKANKLEYRVGMFNGNGITRSANDNDSFQYDARVRFQPNGAVPLADTSGPLNSESDFESWQLARPLFALGAAYEHSDFRHTSGDPSANLTSDLVELDAIYKYRGLFATAAYVFGRREPEGDDRFDTDGWLAQGGYFFKKDTWEIAGRYGETNPSDLVDRDAIKEVGAALSYFYNKHNLKVQADFRRVTFESIAKDTVNYELRVQTQFIF